MIKTTDYVLWAPFSVEHIKYGCAEQVRLPWVSCCFYTTLQSFTKNGKATWRTVEAAESALQAALMGPTSPGGDKENFCQQTTTQTQQPCNKIPAKLPQCNGLNYPATVCISQVWPPALYRAWSSQEVGTHLALALEGNTLQVLLGRATKLPGLNHGCTGVVWGNDSLPTKASRNQPTASDRYLCSRFAAPCQTCLSAWQCCSFSFLSCGDSYKGGVRPAKPQ